MKLASAIESEIKRSTRSERAATFRAVNALRARVERLEAAVNLGAFAPGALRALLKFATLQGKHKTTTTSRATAGRVSASGYKARTPKAYKGPILPAPSPATIRKLRGDMRAVEFAKLLGVSGAAVYMWEKGSNSPSPAVRVILARLLKSRTKTTTPRKRTTKPKTKTKTVTPPALPPAPVHSKDPLAALAS